MVASDGSVVLARVGLTETAMERLRGLLMRPEPQMGQGLLLVPCASVHSCFMSYAIDVVFLDRQERIVKIVREMQPFRLAMAPGSHRVLEMRAGETERCGMKPGDQLFWVEAS